ncbi:MAG: HAD family hydrolase [Myxococcota bacterium]|nr:HAD family hydrolase [Myxococcota bacterium]
MTDAPRVILLDLDDTILSYSRGNEAHWDELALEYAPRLRTGVEELSFALEKARRWFWSDRERNDRGRLDMLGSRRAIVADALRRLELVAHAELGQELADRYTWEREERMQLFPGALEKLSEWRAAGIPLALCTNGHPSFQRAKIERFALEPFFDAILVEGELGFGKPDPRVFRGALEALGAGPDEAWMVGDNLSADIAGAQSVGVHGVWVDHRDVGLPEGSEVSPDRRVTAIAELDLAG